jgi:hypothetical protein
VKVVAVDTAVAAVAATAVVAVTATEVCTSADQETGPSGRFFLWGDDYLNIFKSSTKALACSARDLIGLSIIDRPQTWLHQRQLITPI